ncbi:putative cytochrome P450 [Xylariales sp. PMI_506]|nr:putative cytochrome P450 [Xylariales sp. PMI_506]
MSLTSRGLALIHGDNLLLAKLYVSNQRFKAQHGCEPIREYPLKDPILGLDYVISSTRAFRQKNLLEKTSERFRSIGYTFRVRGFHRRTTFTADPENVKTILSSRFKDFALGGRSSIMGPMLGKGIFTTDGSEWTHSRAFLRPYFTKDHVADLSILYKHTGDLFDKLPKDPSTIDIKLLLYRLTLDTATEFLFGTSTNTLSNAKPIDLEFEEALGFAFEHMAFLVVVGPVRRFYYKNRKYLEAVRICRAYVDTFVEETMSAKNSGTSKCMNSSSESEQKKYSLLEQLAMDTDDKDKIRGELLSLLLAGRDTSGALISNLIDEFSRNPEVWAKVKEEVKQLDGRNPTYTELRNLKYSKYCINESLRLHPPVPISAKTAVCDTVLPRGGGADGKAPVFIPKGHKVVYSTDSMHHNKNVFGEDADQFRPERWETLRATWGYLPFNGGPRACLGQQYALTEALYVVVRFAQKFDRIESRDDAPWTECLGLTASPERG